ncbi:MAG: alpha-amylase [Ignavibacteria bacterium]|nr:alpha-amylase [Ignavibacteria bacterium]
MVKESLEKLYKELKNLSFKPKNYFIPGIWLDNAKFGEIFDLNPKDFFVQSFNKILDFNNNEQAISSNPIVYSMLVRYTTAYDHDGDGKINLNPLENGFFETGTFLKTIAILPYLKNLGVEIIYLLPITKIGTFRKKGNLGSPYACKNPLKLDERLAEPFLNLPVEIHFKAFVEACHLLGIKVVLEFVLRTASLDSELALEKPNWFYWVSEEVVKENSLLPPRFSEKELKEICDAVAKEDFSNLIPPPKEYIGLFTEIPNKVFYENENLVGILTDGKRVTVPNAFADWPPDDKQPPWTDITYFRYFEHSSFNYIAYNTVRMYAEALLNEGKKLDDLWNFLAQLIPYYISNFEIDGAMIDMGHAIPKELLTKILKTARETKSDFIFWEENFNITNDSVENGYNATLGYLPFVQAEPKGLKEIIEKIEKKNYPLPFFLAPETHNTPRASKLGCDFSKLVWTFNSFLPGIRFILSGFEICDSTPYNTGLCFTENELKEYPPEKLPLFSALSMNWNGENLVKFIKVVNELIEKYRVNSVSFFEYELFSVKTNNVNVLSYLRKSHLFEILVVGNFSEGFSKFTLDIGNPFSASFRLEFGDICVDNEGAFVLPGYGYALWVRALSSG